jgi:tetratricopeptide (TPR) repeat protein
VDGNKEGKQVKVRVRGAWLLAGAFLSACGLGCGKDRGATSGQTSHVDAPRVADAPELQEVTLPDLSVVAQSVREQLASSYSSLQAKIANTNATKRELGAANGEMGKLLMAADFLDQAVPCFINARTLLPDDSRWSYYLGHLYRQQGDVQQAAGYFREALEDRPNDVTVSVWLGDVYLSQGNPDAAAAVLTPALSNGSGTAAVLFGLGRAALAKKEYRRAVEFLERAVSTEQKPSEMHYALAMAYRGSGQSAKAQEHLPLRGDGKVTFPDPLLEELQGLLESAMVYELRGVQALEDGNWEAATAHFRSAIALEPDAPSLHHRLGTSLLMAGDTRGGRDELTAALRLAPGFARAHFSLGVLADSEGRSEEAVQRFTAALRYDPGYIEARLLLAGTLRRMGRYIDSLNHYKEVVNADPRVADGHFGYAMVLIGLNRYKEARAALSDGILHHPGETRLTHALARVLASAPDRGARDGVEALRLMQTLPKEEMTVERAETMAMTLAELGRFSEAVVLQRQLVAAASGNAQGDVVRQLTDTLRRYEQGVPSRTPWRQGELP